MSLSTYSCGGVREEVTANSAWGLAAICCGMFMVTLDGVALNLALPTIQRELHGTLSQLEWVVTAYTLPLASLLLTTGALGDRWGARRLYIGSLIAFALTSLLCAMSPSLTWLVVSRVLQGIAAAGLLPMVLSLVAKSWTDKESRATAVNTLASSGAIAMVIGPFGGGVITQHLGWPAIFLINLPMGLLGAWLASRYLLETPRRNAPLDVPGLSSGTFALTALMSGLIESNTLGRLDPTVLASVALGTLGLILFVRIELRASHPMLPLNIFRNATFSAACAGGLAFQFSFYGLLFMLALYTQKAWGATPLEAGILQLPFAATLIITTFAINPMFLHRGARWMLLVGGAIALTGGLVTLCVSTPATWPAFVLGTVLIGLGSAVYSPTLNAVATTSVDPKFAGLASGVYNTSRQIGMALGIAILGSLVGGGAHADAGLRIGMVLILTCIASIVLLAFRYVRS